MPLFSRKPKPVPGPLIALSDPPSPPLTATDWADDKHIRAEWTSLEGEENARLGWSNGMRLFEQGPIPAQLLNVAEYMTRGLAYTYIGQPLISNEQAAETVRRILQAISSMPPTAPSFQWQFAPKLVRLALAVARQKGWQPVSLGGNDEIGEDLLGADVIVDSIGTPGTVRSEYLRHFFSLAEARGTE